MLGDEDIPFLLDDFGVRVVFNGVATKALSDAYDVQEGALQSVEVQGRVVDLSVASNAWTPFPTRNAAITVDGVAMKVREIDQQKDGSITHLYVVPA